MFLYAVACKGLNKAEAFGLWEEIINEL